MRKWQFAFVLSWALLIFGTSCTVVSTDQLFSLINFVFGSTISQRFEIFWAIAWFTVVKGWHVTEFAILTGGLIALLNAGHPTKRRRNILLAAVLALLFAASDEFHQTYVPTRDGTVADVLIDTLGVGIVSLLALRQ